MNGRRRPAPDRLKGRRRAGRGPGWLRGLARVKAELRGTRFPRTAEEGFRQCAELSAASLSLLREEIKKDRTGASERQVDIAMSHLLARFADADTRWASRWRRHCARSFGR